MRDSKENNLKLDDYVSIIKKINNWVKDKQWKGMFLKDLTTNEEVARNLIKIINKANVNLTIDELKAFMLEIRKSSEDNLEKINTLKQPEKWLYTRELYCYYAIHEALVEYSQFSDSIVDEMIKVLGTDYIEKIKEIDKSNPSRLTNFKFEDNKEADYMKLPEVEKYLILKEWQDSQHIYYTNKLAPIYESVWDEFDIWVNENYPEYKEFKNLKLAFILMKDKSVLDIETLAKFIVAGFEDDVVKLVGGKALGLIKLYINGMTIPKTYFIPKTKTKNFNQLEKNFGFDKFAVRSSATTEDNKENSFAGLFDSYLNVTPDDLLNKINQVIESATNERVKAYVTRLNNINPEMAVVIQEFRIPEYSGVWIGNDLNKGILEWTKGTGDKLVSGTITPKTEIWNDNIVNAPLCLSDKPIAKHCMEIQEKLNTTADLEWCIVENKLIWLQYRPVTKIINLENTNTIKDNNLIYGIPASSGTTSGKVIFLDNYELDNWENGSILLTYTTDPNWVPIILNAKGMITADGGFLSHTAIISRELNIPCITGIGEKALEKLKTAKNIELNGNNGSIKINF